MDNSRRGVPLTNWLLRTQVISYILESLPVGRDQDHVAMMLYGSSANLQFRLNEYYDKNLIERKISAFPTNIDVSVLYWFVYEVKINYEVCS